MDVWASCGELSRYGGVVGVKITTRVDQTQLLALLSGPNGAVAKELTRRAIRVENRAKQLAPVDTGRLRSSISHELRQNRRATLVARVGTNVDYALAVHDGTGIYGPKGTPIRPVSDRVLRFPVRGPSPGGRSRSITATGFVFAASVKGTPPRPFLRNALPAARN